MENKPVLKKVRRPINRIQPLTSSPEISNTPVQSQPLEDAPDMATVAPVTQSEEVNSTSLNDEYSSQQKTQSNAANVPSVELASSQNYNQTDYNYNNEEQYVNNEYPEEYFVEEGHRISVKLFVFCFVLALIIGALLGKYLLSEPQVSHNGLQGVVSNTEVPRGRARCGMAERTQGCVLYIMNPQRQNVKAKDFYDMAAQMTGLQRFMIETGNMHYANTEIRPGDIAQLNIPPL